jgi:formylglycine-generating enzyme required for sulfatase activity
MYRLALTFLFLAAGPAAADQLCEGYAGLPTGDDATAGMVAIPGGTFIMGDADERPEERTPHEVTLSPFMIDRHEVTNAQFRAFVEATGYVTVAEAGLDPAEYPGLPPELLVPGGMVFDEPETADLRGSVAQWWRYVPGASWRHPAGPESSIEGLDNHPVVQVAHADALAYAQWLGRDLPTEAEWEFAARGGLEGATYTWGDSYDPVQGWLANSWQGSFPVSDQALDGHHGTAPVGCFEANGYGLLDMGGNVWEYVSDYYLPGHFPDPATDPTGPDAKLSARYSPTRMPQVVVKGGSWLCAPNFCLRYRPAARQPQEPDLSSNHIGFRTVLRDQAG